MRIEPVPLHYSTPYPLS